MMKSEALAIKITKTSQIQSKVLPSCLLCKSSCKARWASCQKKNVGCFRKRGSVLEPARVRSKESVFVRSATCAGGQSREAAEGAACEVFAILERTSLG